MFKKTRTSYYTFGAAITVGMLMASGSAHAVPAGGGGNDFGKISENITNSIQNVPALLTALSYLFGILLGTLGIMKIKDHVENPTQTPLKDGAIRLLTGGALFSLPIIFESMSDMLDRNDAGGVNATDSALAQAVEFNIEAP